MSEKSYRERYAELLKKQGELGEKKETIRKKREAKKKKK